jgi:hypothetical protein
MDNHTANILHHTNFLMNTETKITLITAAVLMMKIAA